jgi:hypothetical protein
MTHDNSVSSKECNWVNKASLYEKARANENYLLHAYIVTFMAIQAVLVALFIGFWNSLQPGWSFIFPFLGILFAILWARVTESRGRPLGGNVGWVVETSQPNRACSI